MLRTIRPIHENTKEIRKWKKEGEWKVSMIMAN